MNMYLSFQKDIVFEEATVFVNPYDEAEEQVRKAIDSSFLHFVEM